MTYAYNPQNVFAKILRGEIPCNKLFETAHTLVFHDSAPQAPVHVMVIPKGAYVNADHFDAEASEVEQADFARAVSRAARETGVAEQAGGNGFRTIANSGPDGVQEVPHYHLHILGGRPLGRMVRAPRD